MADQATNETVFTDSVQDQTAGSVVGEVTTSNQSSSNAYEDLLKTITAEDGRQKYQSVEDALKAMTHAQKHIRTIEEENAAVKRELEKRKTAEELLSGITAPRGGEQNTNAALDPSVVEQLIEQKLQAKTQEAAKQKNLEAVNEAFISHFGDVEKAKAAYKSAAEEAGVGLDFMTDLAARSPEAVLKLAGIKGNAITPTAKSSSSINTAGLPKVENNRPNGSLVYASTQEIASYWKSLANT